MGKVVILIIAHKSSLSENEIASVRQCHKVLGKYSIQLICPENLDVSLYKKIIPNCPIRFIDPRWLSTYSMFGRLKASPLLYEMYKKYDFILFYELDAWVFRDELEYWCNLNFDYIGAPWFEGWDMADSQSKIIGVGNGGFSLRKVKTHLRALRGPLYSKSPNFLVQQLKNRRNLKAFFELLYKPTIDRTYFSLPEDWDEPEDVFWCFTVAHRFKWFKVAPVDVAMKFSFELNPRILYHLNNDSLPFGCHKWEKYEPEFWTPFIQSAK